jgi:hypothetical protein
VTGAAYAERYPWIVRARSRAAAVPVWAWLVLLVAVSAAIRFVLAKQHPAPWIFDDELIYSKLATSFADSGTLVVRGAHIGVGPVYPILISPAYKIFADPAHAYAAAKAINAVVMSLAAIPAYLLARRLLGTGLSFLAAALTVAIPSMTYTGTIMTENAFYPAFLTCALALVLVLERPTLWRQVFLLAAIGVTFLIRAQGIVLLGALVTSILAVVVFDAAAARESLWSRAFVRRLDAFRMTWLLLVAGAILVLAAEVARGRSVGNILGAYRGVTSWSYSVRGVARWFLYHIAELDLYLGILPFAAFLVLLGVAFRRDVVNRPLAIFAAATASLTVWLTLSAAAFAARNASANGGLGRIEERTVFHVAPFFLIALLVWVGWRGARPWRGAAVAAVVAAALPGLIPYGQLVNLSALSDTFAFIPIYRLASDGTIGFGDMPFAITLASLVAALLFLVLPRRLALLAPLLVLAYFAFAERSLDRQIGETSSGVLAQGLSGRREWIDEKVGTSARVVALWTGNASPLSVSENEFFNRSVRDVYAVEGAPPLPVQLPEAPTTLSPSGAILLGGRPARTQYALADRSVTVQGRPVARDAAVGTAVYRVDGPLRLRERVTGIYADGWSGPTVSYTRYACRGGRLRLVLAGQQGLSPAAARVSAAGKSVSVPKSGASRTLSVPLRPRGGRCDAVVSVSPVFVPAQVVGTPDTRSLGVRVLDRRYEPPRGSA